MSIYEILEELNLENGSNYKLKTLKKYSDNELLKRVMKMTYDRVNYTFGITMKNVHAGSAENTISLQEALDGLDKLNAREYTGNAAIGFLENLLENVSETNAIVLRLIVGRDLKINLGRTSINKVWKNLIPKPCYCRCDIYKEKTAKNINFPAIVQLKADGTYRESLKDDKNVKFTSRSGEPYNYKNLEDSLSSISDKFNGYFVGELTVKCDDKILERIIPSILKEDIKNGTNNAETIQKHYREKTELGKEYILPRGIGNGLINSDDVPYDNLIYDLWDFVNVEDYALASLKDRKNTPKVPYKERFSLLQEAVKELKDNGIDNIRVIEYKLVENLKEVSDFASEKMKDGLEGAILKDWEMLFKDGTSKQQLKMKISFELDVRITGFIEGTKGTKREETFGSVEYSTDDGMIKGSVSGFSDDQLKDFNSRREELIGVVFTLEGNDLTKGRGNVHYAVSHPRFIELRTDKDSTDDLERALDILESAKEFKDKEKTK